MKKLFKNCDVILADKILKDGAVLVEDGKIVWLGTANEDLNHKADEVVDCEGKFLSPGFIDVHCHGGGGGMFMTPDLQQHVNALKAHMAHGVTSMTPASIVNNAEEMKKLVEIKKTIDGMDNLPNHLGYFMEGPYNIPHPDMAVGSDELPVITEDKYAPIVEASEGTIKRWMAAPELEGALDFGRYIKNHGIIPCMGHSNATYNDVEEATKAGYSTVIHLYSVMSTVTRDKGFRRGGLVEAGLLIDDLDVELICDGCHLPPELINLAIKVKGYDKIMLVSDAIPLAGMGLEGEFEMMGMKLVIEDGVCKPPARNCFMGSIATGDRLVRTVHKTCGHPLWAAVRMASKTPARHLGYEGIKGEIAIGADADLITFDEDINIHQVFLKGRKAV